MSTWTDARKKGKNNESYKGRNHLHTVVYSSCADAPVCVLVRLSAMNELVTREMLVQGVASEQVFDLVEEYKTANEKMKTLKYQFQKLCEELGLTKWETDYFYMNYIDETTSTKVDVERMKSTDIYITDALTGELEEVNAYEFFTKKSVTKAHVTYKEKK